MNEEDGGRRRAIIGARAIASQSVSRRTLEAARTCQLAGAVDPMRVRVDLRLTADKANVQVNAIDDLMVESGAPLSPAQRDCVLTRLRTGLPFREAVGPYQSSAPFTGTAYARVSLAGAGSARR